MPVTFDFARHCDAIADALRGPGWLVVSDFIAAAQCADLLADCRQRQTEFVAAAVGRGEGRHRANEQRRDTTLWLRGDIPVQNEFLQAMDAVRGELNRRLYLGLHDYEAHYAHYAAGAFYRRHRDAFAAAQTSRNESRRILTSVMYLNSAPGGELVLWREEYELARIAPVAGTAVFFLSAEFPHEVLPAHADRYSIAGWFRSR